MVTERLEKIAGFRAVLANPNLRGVASEYRGNNVFGLRVTNKEEWSNSLPLLEKYFFRLINEGFELQIGRNNFNSSVEFKHRKLQEMRMIFDDAEMVYVYADQAGNVLGFLTTEIAMHDSKILIQRDVVVSRLTRRPDGILDALAGQVFPLLQDGVYDAIVGISANPLAIRARKRNSEKYGASTLFGIETSRLGTERQVHILKAVSDQLALEGMLAPRQPDQQYRGLVYLIKGLVPPITQAVLEKTQKNHPFYSALRVMYLLQEKSSDYVVAGHLVSVRSETLPTSHT